MAAAYHCPMRRVMLLLAAVLALVPASGATLCVADSGRMTIEISGCGPSADATCLEACGGCEDTPLSVGAAHRATVHVGFDAALLPTAAPRGFAAASPSFRSAALPRVAPSRGRTTLLRC